MIKTKWPVEKIDRLIEWGCTGLSWERISVYMGLSDETCRRTFSEQATPQERDERRLARSEARFLGEELLPEHVMRRPRRNSGRTEFPSEFRFDDAGQALAPSYGRVPLRETIVHSMSTSALAAQSPFVAEDMG